MMNDNRDVKKKRYVMNHENLSIIIIVFFLIKKI